MLGTSWLMSFGCSKRPSTYSPNRLLLQQLRMHSRQPPWLQPFLKDTSPSPRLFAWGPSNIGTQLGDERPFSNNSGDLDRRIFIMGIGNLGRLFASDLAQLPDRPPITLVVHRMELITQWMSGDGIQILRSGVLDTQKGFDIEWWTESQPEFGPVREVSDGNIIQNLLVATKAGAALPEVDRVRRYLDRTSTIAFAQNGMSKLWPPHGPSYVSHRYKDQDAPNFMACVTTHGVTSLAPFKSLHASPADVAVGLVLPNAVSPEGANYLRDQIIKAPHLDGKSVTRAELWVLQLEKLVVNAVINPLTAILRCKNGVLFEDPSGVLEKVIDQLLGEASAILQALVNHDSSSEIITGTSLSSNTQVESLRQSLEERFSKPRLKEMVYRVGEKVKENTSSMLQDALLGKPTEVRDFNGWLVDTATFLDERLDVQGHQTLVDLVESGSVLAVNQLSTAFFGSTQA